VLSLRGQLSRALAIAESAPAETFHDALVIALQLIDANPTNLAQLPIILPAPWPGSSGRGTVVVHLRDEVVVKLGRYLILLFQARRPPSAESRTLPGNASPIRPATLSLATNEGVFILVSLV
jgi:hypothetical protein